MRSAQALEAYLARIGYAGPREASIEVLAALHAAHVAAIPFENLDPLLGRPVRLDAASLQAKLVAGRRGGYCYEHNLLFADALRALGFAVRQLAARVMWGVAEGGQRPRTHMLLRVELGGEALIADVGFGGMTLPSPLRLAEPSAQATPFGRFRLLPAGGEYVLQADTAGEWRPLYRFDLQAQQLVDHELTSWYLCHHPESFFRQSLMAARIGAEARLALLGNRLSVYPPRGEPVVTLLETAADLRQALEDRFGIDLGGIDGIDALLARLAAQR